MSTFESIEFCRFSLREPGDIIVPNVRVQVVAALFFLGKGLTAACRRERWPH